MLTPHFAHILTSFSPLLQQQRAALSNVSNTPVTGRSSTVPNNKVLQQQQTIVYGGSQANPQTAQRVAAALAKSAASQSASVHHPHHISQQPRLQFFGHNPNLKCELYSTF